MQLEAYTTGSVSIANGSATLTGIGTAWKTAGLKEGDLFYYGGYVMLFASVDDEDQITCVGTWPGETLSDASYVIIFAPDNSRMQGTTRQLLDELRQGIWLTPDATGKTADRATYDARPAGFRFLDVSVDPFKLYVKESDTSGDWSAGADWVGPKGDDGSSDVVGTSTTSLAIATGSKTFAITEVKRGWGVGARLRASSDADGANWMEGIVTSYASDSLALSVDLVGGSGTFADWTINLAGSPGDISSADTDASSFGFVLDEDDMASDSNKKVPTQQSVNHGKLQKAADLTALAALAPSKHSSVFVESPADQNLWMGTTADISTEITAGDPRYVAKSSDTTGAAGGFFQAGSVSTGEFFTDSGARMARAADRFNVGDAAKHNGKDQITQPDWLTKFEIAKGRAGGSLMYSTMGVSGNLHPRNSNTLMVGANGDGNDAFYNTIAVRALATTNSAHDNVHAYAGYFEAYRGADTPSGANGIEIDTMNYASAVTINPFLQASGQTIGLQLAAGGEFATAGQFASSAAINIRNNNSDYKSGIVFGNDALEGTDGSTGQAEAIAFASLQSMNYYYADGLVNWQLYAGPGADNDYNITTAGAGAVSVTALKEVVGKAWTAYTPTISSSSGTITTKSATGRYRQLGKTIFIQIAITITTNGTGAGAINATLPFTVAAASYCASGRATGVSGKMLQAFMASGAATMTVFNYDNTYPAADGETLVISGVFERN